MRPARRIFDVAHYRLSTKVISKPRVSRCWIFLLLHRSSSHKRKITTLTEARKLVDEMLRQRRFTILREIKAWLDGVKNFEDSIEAIGALRELLADEDLLA